MAVPDPVEEGANTGKLASVTYGSCPVVGTEGQARLHSQFYLIKVTGQPQLLREHSGTGMVLALIGPNTITAPAGRQMCSPLSEESQQEHQVVLFYE